MTLKQKNSLRQLCFLFENQEQHKENVIKAVERFSKRYETLRKTKPTGQVYVLRRKVV